MKKFLVLYIAPTATMEDWAKTDAKEREVAEKKMRTDWDTWMEEHASMMETTAGAGKTKRVTSEGVSDTKNDIMLYSIVEADSHEAAAKSFENHPHFGIPGAAIEIMEINPLTKS